LGLIVVCLGDFFVGFDVRERRSICLEFSFGGRTVMCDWIVLLVPPPPPPHFPLINESGFNGFY